MQSNMEGLAKEEFRLAKEMKEKFCDELGREIDAAKTAEIIHRIGRIYRQRSPDKISLIQSAGLFNAAIVRKPRNTIQMEIDLAELCQHILQMADAKNQKVNLIKKAEEVKDLLSDWRTEVEKILNNSVSKIPTNISEEKMQQLKRDKISAIQQLNHTITDKYKQIMVDLFKFCEGVMGEPPCKYAIVGLGSLARTEITPYSDFEYIILLENDFANSTNFEFGLEYFRWYSVIFHVIILNLKETIIPSLGVRSLNGLDFDFGIDWFLDRITPQGISFDGMMLHASKFPLGRQQPTKSKQWIAELIKPVDAMLNYLIIKNDFKNGYQLATILIKNCYVFGSESIYAQFVDGIPRYQREQMQTIAANSEMTITNDLEKYSTRSVLTKFNLHTLNVKHIFRSMTIFIEDFGNVYNISKKSSFEAINEMVSKCIITKNTAEKLNFAIAIACEIRLRVYMDKKSQWDHYNLQKCNENIKTFLDIVGTTSTINYFQIAFAYNVRLQKE